MQNGEWVDVARIDDKIRVCGRKFMGDRRGREEIFVRVHQENEKIGMVISIRA